jgi:hypothetical protein
LGHFWSDNQKETHMMCQIPKLNSQPTKRKLSALKRSPRGIARQGDALNGAQPGGRLPACHTEATHSVHLDPCAPRPRLPVACGDSVTPNVGSTWVQRREKRREGQGGAACHWRKGAPGRVWSRWTARGADDAWRCHIPTGRGVVQLCVRAAHQILTERGEDENVRVVCVCVCQCVCVFVYVCLYIRVYVCVAETMNVHSTAVCAAARAIWRRAFQAVLGFYGS